MRFLQPLLLCAALLACAEFAAGDVPPDLCGVKIPSAGEKLIGRFYTPALLNPEVPASQPPSNISSREWMHRTMRMVMLLLLPMPFHLPLILSPAAARFPLAFPGCGSFAPMDRTSSACVWIIYRGVTGLTWLTG